MEVKHVIPGPDKKTLVDILKWRASETPDRPAHIFLVDGEKTEEVHTYAELDRKARAIAARLQSLGGKGERVMILLQPGLQFISAYFGCLYAGHVAIPLYPHLRKKKDNILTRIMNVAKDARPVAVISNTVIESASSQFFQEVEETRSTPWVNLDQLSLAEAENWKDLHLDPDEIAFLQYTSGSTNVPKGVMVSHGNLVHNTQAIYKKFNANYNSRGVVWLPPYHDMGLIGGILEPIYGGFLVYLMPPPYFLQRPLRWLEAISRLKTDISGGPNFAYEYCVKKVRPEQRDQLDLSHWKTAFSGAEPINPDTLRRFADYFAPCGFHYDNYQPCYGLAEGTLLVTSVEQTDDPVTAFFNKEGLEKNQIIPTSEMESSRELVGCGDVGFEMGVRIVNPDTLELCKPNEIGEVWASGGSIAKGYWAKPEQSEETFNAHIKDTGEGPFMRTGDLGFMRDGQLYITGRIKELIIIDGSNHYPQDIEWTVEKCHEAVRPHGVSAFPVEVDGSEKLVLMTEIEPRILRDMTDELRREIRRAIKSGVSAEHDLSVHEIVFVNRLPRTTSGKIRHHQCKKEFLAMLEENKAG
jgi:acyl-CoA synthetase (AMP-forming)/AMP-acid ligase II